MKFTAQASVVTFILALMSGSAMADCASEGGVFALTIPKNRVECFRPFQVADCKGSGGAWVPTIKGKLACLKPLAGDCKRQGGAFANTIEGRFDCFKAN